MMAKPMEQIKRENLLRKISEAYDYAEGCSLRAGRDGKHTEVRYFHEFTEQLEAMVMQLQADVDQLENAR